MQRHSVIHLFLVSLTAPAIKTIKLNIKLKSKNVIRKVKRIENHDNPSQTGHTALQRAAAGGHLDIARLLVTQGASLDHQDELVSVMMVVVVVIVMMMMMIANLLGLVLMVMVVMLMAMVVTDWHCK